MKGIGDSVKMNKDAQRGCKLFKALVPVHMNTWA